jgi:hypothetical protein
MRSASAGRRKRKLVRRVKERQSAKWTKRASRESLKKKNVLLLKSKRKNSKKKELSAKGRRTREGRTTLRKV